MFGKTTTRLPESLSYGHSPLTSNGSNIKERRSKIAQEGPLVYSMSVADEADNSEDLEWLISKMGQDIDPCDVVLNGSQYVHGKDKHVWLRSSFCLKFAGLCVHRQGCLFNIKLFLSEFILYYLKHPAK